MSGHGERKTPYQRWVETGREQTYTEWLENELKVIELSPVAGGVDLSMIASAGVHAAICNGWDAVPGQDNFADPETVGYQTKAVMGYLSALQTKPVEVWEVSVDKLKDLFNADFTGGFERIKDYVEALRTQPQDQVQEPLGWWGATDKVFAPRFFSTKPEKGDFQPVYLGVQPQAPVVYVPRDDDLELMVRRCLANAKQNGGGYDVFLRRHISEGIKALLQSKGIP